MEDLEAQLKDDPGQFATFVATPESFAERPLGEPLDWKPPAPAELKLYQPAHGHFYLIACSLVCRLPGLPDRKIDKARSERASFVLRRLVPIPGTTSEYTEYGWMVNGTTSSWQEVKPAESILDKEERLPLFGMNFTEEGRTRRLLVGYVPVASRETFQAISELTPAPAPPDSEGDPRLAELQTRVINPLNSLATDLTDSSASDEDAQQVSLFILLDFADFLQLNLPTVWDAVLNGPGPNLVGAEKTLYDQLDQWTIDGTTWRDTLDAVWQQRDNINASGEAMNPPLAYDLRGSSVSGDTISNTVEAALGPFTPPPTPAGEVRVPKIDPLAGDLYVLRCAYEQPQCSPFHTPYLVSDPSERFQLAPFLDPDAPSRPIQIALPVDTSIAGLRKFKKNVAFVMSDKLRSQLSKLGKEILTEGEAGAGSQFTLGHICSFSISIIFICAFVLLLVIAIALNIVFWWMAFFKICFPIPVKK
jgi:hypothetical protein